MKLFSSIWNPSKMVVVFLQLRKEGNLLTACQYKKDGTAMQSLETFESVQALLKKFGNSKAYWLQVEGSGVLSRLVDRASGYKDDLIINGDKDDFYFSSITDGEKSIVSFVRKNTVSAIEEAFNEAKVHLLGLSCGIVPSVLAVGASGTHPFSHWQDQLITDQNGIYTNGGAYSFLNLLIYLIEKYYDRQTAIFCAKVFQIEMDRQSQSAFTIFTGSSDDSGVSYHTWFGFFHNTIGFF